MSKKWKNRLMNILIATLLTLSTNTPTICLVVAPAVNDTFPAVPKYTYCPNLP